MNSSSSNPNQNNNNPNPLQKKKSTGGRKKLPMEKIKNETSRQVTFSKRQGGLVKKASELSTLTGIEIALVVFSPGGKAYSYGNPSVERVTSRWMYANAYTHDKCAPGSVMQAAILNRQNESIAKSQAKVEVLRNRKRELMSAKVAAQLSGTYPPALETLRYDQLNALKSSILGFKSSFEANVKETKDITSAKLLKAPVQRAQCFSNVIGSSSSNVAQRNEMVHEVLNSNIIINDNVNTNQGMATQKRGQCFYNVVGSSSSTHVAQRNQMVPEVFNNNIVNGHVDPNQGTYKGFFNTGGFANYNPSSIRYGGSSSFAFPSSNNAGQLASSSVTNYIEAPDGESTFCDPKELPFGDMRFLSQVPDLVPACDGSNGADVLPKHDVAKEETSAAPNQNGQSEGNYCIGDDFMEELLWDYGAGY